MEEEKGYINYDEVTTNRLLKLVYDNQGAFPLDGEPAAESERGITSGAVYEEIRKLRESTVAGKGLFATEGDLKSKWPSPQVGDWAIVGNTVPGTVYQCKTAGTWSNTGQQGGGGDLELDDYLQCEEITDVTTIL